MDKTLKWLFFDMGGVILDDEEPEKLRQALLLEVAKRYLPDVSMDDIYGAWWKASSVKGSLRMEALKILFAGFPNMEQIEQEYRRLCTYDYQGLSHIRPEAKEILGELSQRYSLGIMANQSIKTTERLEESGLLSYFSHQKMSAHMGLEKPEPKFFATILEESGARADESAIIDDNYMRGLVPAKELGMTTILFKRFFIPYPSDAKPDYSINKLEDLIPLFL